MGFEAGAMSLSQLSARRLGGAGTRRRRPGLSDRARLALAARVFVSRYPPGTARRRRIPHHRERGVRWFGIGEWPKAILIRVGTLPVIIIGAMSGVKSTPPLRIEVARTLGASSAQIFRKVVLPSAMLKIFTAMRVGIGVAWIFPGTRPVVLSARPGRGALDVPIELERPRTPQVAFEPQFLDLKKRAMGILAR
ncbi:ABC transporter permease [Paraburkholderia silvatlantica]|nr:ABC transporter permease subunit [Paraburkholderia silvatlantica]